jgi:hypothetical protein
MKLFRRNEETLNEQLLREAGLDDVQRVAEPERVVAPPPLEPPPFADVEHPGGGPLGHDVLVVAHAPGLAGADVSFVTLPTGDLIVEAEQGDADLSPLAEAVEREVAPPYRAIASRQKGDLWGIAANRLDVRRFACQGDEIELVGNGGSIAVTVDGEPSDVSIPELEPAGDAVVHASRIDGDYWEVEEHPL